MSLRKGNCIDLMAGKSTKMRFPPEPHHHPLITTRHSLEQNILHRATLVIITLLDSWEEPLHEERICTGKQTALKRMTVPSQSQPVVHLVILYVAIQLAPPVNSPGSRIHKVIKIVHRVSARDLEKRAGLPDKLRLADSPGNHQQLIITLTLRNIAQSIINAYKLHIINVLRGG